MIVNVGMVLQVFPKERSHSQIPYNVIVVDVFEHGFITELIDPDKVITKNPHKRIFDYRRPEWNEYHHDRFKVISK